MLLIQVFECPGSLESKTMAELRERVRQAAASVQDSGLKPEQVSVQFVVNDLIPPDPRALIVVAKMITETPMISLQHRCLIIGKISGVFRELIEREDLNYAKIVTHFDGFSRTHDESLTIPLKVKPIFS